MNFIWSGLILLAFILGTMMSSHKWRENADRPARILSRGNFYKVVRLNDKTSESYVNLHVNKEN